MVRRSPQQPAYCLVSGLDGARTQEVFVVNGASDAVGLFELI
jgi:hypothetical protein